MNAEEHNENPSDYWDATASQYQGHTRIATDDFHYGPLLPGDQTLNLLPAVEGLRCLELAGGAGQNSIYLTAQGAGECTSVDSSAAQQDHGRSLAEASSSPIRWIVDDMDALPADLKDYDLIHTNSLSFSAGPAALVRDVYERLNPGGVFLMACIHPLFQFEWLELGDEEGHGLFVTDYFNPPDDVRPLDDSDEVIRSSSWPVSMIVGWLIDAGFRIEAMREPCALPADSVRPPPYVSDTWLELRDQLEHIPLMLIIKARRD